MKKLILIITLLLTSIAFAETKQYNFWWEQLPAVCSTSDEIGRWAKDKNFMPLNYSYGRHGGKPDGKIVYTIVYWMNDKGETFASVHTPEKKDQMCILFRTFDLTMNE
ncbi:uncharacterized protein METZ01_LOCUS412623, partial [marine metagenome]